MFRLFVAWKILFLLGFCLVCASTLKTGIIYSSEMSGFLRITQKLYPRTPYLNITYSYLSLLRILCCLEGVWGRSVLLQVSIICRFPAYGRLCSNYVGTYSHLVTSQGCLCYTVHSLAFKCGRNWEWHIIYFRFGHRHVTGCKILGWLR